MSYLLTRTGRKSLNEALPPEGSGTARKKREERIEKLSTNIDDAIKNAREAGEKKLAKELENIKKTL